MAQDFILEAIQMRRPQEEKIQIDETAARTAPALTPDRASNSIQSATCQSASCCWRVAVGESIFVQGEIHTGHEVYICFNNRWFRCFNDLQPHRKLHLTTHGLLFGGERVELLIVLHFATVGKFIHVADPRSSLPAADRKCIS